MLPRRRARRGLAGASTRRRDPSIGSPWFADLYLLFSTVRQEAAALSERDVDEAIRDAVATVRSAPPPSRSA
mgnify:CR=1 FL=1